MEVKIIKILQTGFEKYSPASSTWGTCSGHVFVLQQWLRCLQTVAEKSALQTLHGGKKKMK